MSNHSAKIVGFSPPSKVFTKFFSDLLRRGRDSATNPLDSPPFLSQALAKDKAPWRYLQNAFSRLIPHT